ncbi:MAG: response regulator transcription factor [Magnetococcales bacterium]|nr:response regulator transcription factor [Magnetococcales bacterium]
MIRLFIADDHAIVREGLKQILARESDLQVCGEADNGKEAVRRLLAEDFDVVLLDVTMPEAGGFDVLTRMRREKPKLPIIILTMHDEEILARRFLKAGAVGYLTKDAAPAQLVAAVRKVARGGKYLSEDLMERLMEELGSDESDKPPHEKLSDREFAILCKLASGMTLSEVARHFHVAASTVSTQRARILEKLNLRNNAELTHYAIKNGLVS